MDIYHPIPKGTVIKYKRLGRRCKREPNIVIIEAIIQSSSTDGVVYWYRLNDSTLINGTSIVSIGNENE